ncbi:MAG: exo-alpha-sialidase, partial [Saprospiraceae bacterium]|nr:exo-alpha-sialidase [Saprospiraceae bacterium]
MHLNNTLRTIYSPGQLLFLSFMISALWSCAVKNTMQSDHAEAPVKVLSLQPGHDNPRNSEGDFIKLKNGDILFIYSHYYGESTSDHATAYLASRISKDGGKTWSNADEIVIQNEGGLNVMSVSLLRLQSGEIALFYLRKNATDDCIPMMRISVDEGRTWGEAIPCITDKKGYFVLNNDRVIQLNNGRLLMAVAQHNEPGGTFTGKGKLYSYYSDNKGMSWKSSTMVDNPYDITFQEPGLVELKDHSILMVIRSNAATQCLTHSKDGGETWSEVTKSQLVSPVSPATIERIPKTNDLLAVWNYNIST